MRSRTLAGLTVFVVPFAAAAHAQVACKLLQPAEVESALGAQFEQKTVGTALCTRSGRPNVAAHSVCAIPRGKGYVEVDVRSPTQQDLASMEAVGALVQKANGRL
jgi:hypothetical protein